MRDSLGGKAEPMFGGSVRASSAEHSQPLPGDDRIPSSIGALTHAVTINAAPAEIWPWLVQMGAGRAGWYSYDMLDNGGHYSANSLLPEYQHLTIGTLMPALPGVRDGFIVLAFDPLHHLVLGWGTPEVPQLTTWVFVLAPVSADRTRLLVRARAGPGYRLFGMPPGVSQHLARPVHWLMQRKQLLGIKRRVESAKSLAA
jgi:hypothetical protein